MVEDDFVETSDVEELADNMRSSPRRWGGRVLNELLEDPPRKRIKVSRSPAMLSMDATSHCIYSSFMADKRDRSLVVPFGLGVTTHPKLE